MNILYEQIKFLPTSPGVYIYKDATGKVIYVGKAVNIKNRVLQYFTAIDKHPVKTKQLVDNIRNIEFMVTNSEEQALIIESNLIKKHKPRYNIRLKDDKAYPYIKISIKDKWPTVSIVRRISNDGNKYFGPFVNSRNVRGTIRVIERIFPFRNCKTLSDSLPKKPCLNYHIGRCSGPCVGAISEQEYLDMIKNIISFLEGKQEQVIKGLKLRMAALSDSMDYEKAAAIRDQIESIDDVIKSQKISLSIPGDKDAIAFTQKGNLAYAEMFIIRGGKVLGHNNLLIEGVKEERPDKIISEILKQYYLVAAGIPAEIVVQYQPEDKKTISEWLTHLRGSKVKMITPVKGTNKKLIDIIEQNAIKGMEFNQLIKYTEVDYSLIAEDIKNVLHLKNVPYRIEGYDISDIYGAFAVGCVVAFEKGKPRKDFYRRFKIRVTGVIDDYSMMQEILERRLNKYLSGEDKWSVIPDLILIDGGKGHLNAALKVFRKLNITNIDIISLAKEQEQIFIPGQPTPIILDYTSVALHLLQRIRDEVHRFAITYHKSLRSKKMNLSLLDEIPGIGAKRKKALLKAFGSTEKMKTANLEDIAGVDGITRKLAESILRQLN
jgi:excinuclease ABC subunit C